MLVVKKPIKLTDILQIWDILQLNLSLNQKNTEVLILLLAIETSQLYED